MSTRIELLLVRKKHAGQMLRQAVRADLDNARPDDQAVVANQEAGVVDDGRSVASGVDDQHSHDLLLLTAASAINNIPR
jgi:hypothetical protein